LRRVPAPTGERTSTRLYLWPLLVLLIAGPLTVVAILQSVRWFDAPFPGFLVMENAVIPSVSGRDWPPDHSALFHSQVIAVDGRPVSGSADVYRPVAAQPAGTAFTYRFRKGGNIFERTLVSRQFTLDDYFEVYGILLLIGVMSLGTGVAVGLMQPRERPARVFVWLSFLGCLFATTAVFLHRAGFPTLTRVYLVTESLFPAAFIHFACVFPVERRVSTMRRGWLVVPYGIAAVLTAVKLYGFYQAPPNLSGLYLSYLYNAVAFVIFLGTFAFAYWENREPLARLRIVALLPSVLLGGGLSALAFINNTFSGGSMPLQLGLLFVPAFYVSIAYAVVKHDLFEIDRFVRRSFVYGVLSLAVIGAYALVLALANRLLPQFGQREQAVVGIIFVLLLAYALDPLRRGVQNLLDRAFYRTRLSYQTTIGALSHALTTLLDLRAVLDQVTRVLTDAMHLSATSVYVQPPTQEEGELWTRQPGGALQREPAPAELAALLAEFEAIPIEMQPIAPHKQRGAIQPCPEPRRRGGVGPTKTPAAGPPAAGPEVALILPLAVGGHTLGLLLLGHKRSGRWFDSADLDLLETLADQTAIAMQNALAVHALETLTRNLDATVRRQTEALQQSHDELRHAYEELKNAQAQLVQSEKMSSLGVLVAGVAHELNNPASFVHGGLANLQAYLERFAEVLEAYEHAQLADPEAARAIDALRQRVRLDYLRQELPGLLRVCAEGSGRIKKIVDDLRLFARADTGDRVPTDIAAGIDSCLQLLGGRLSGTGIVVRRHYEPVPRIDAYTGKLNQVWMNLLGNALDAVVGRTDAAIDLTVRRAVSADHSPEAIDWVEVQVRDNGSGIAPADLTRVFEPFFTTKPIGSGTGLGLSIVYGAVKSHGGTITIESEPGSGTLVTVRLPLHAGGDACGSVARGSVA
jgi:signal transduction histidine kinase